MQDLMPPIGTQDGLFHDGNPATGEIGTLVTALWLNAVQSAARNVQAELKNLLEELGGELDPGKDDQLKTLLKDALADKAPVDSPDFTGAATGTTPSQFDKSKRLPTTEFVRTFGKQLSGVTPVQGALVGTVAHVGGKVYGYGATLNSYSVPNSTAGQIPTGATVTIANFGSSAMTIVPQGTDKLGLPTGSTPTSFVMPSGTSAEFTLGNGGIWFITGTAVLASSAQFGVALGQSGYQKLPSGLLIQWGQVTATAGGVLVLYPVAFPNNVFTATIGSNGAAASYVWTTWPITTSGFYAYTAAPSAASTWIAIGY
ncbi:gp53-like domain-containing protein [Cupriavidus sp. 30B13]|uniref:gp53-like domain-containing protein n=1 Tax=Cupriavidus sp. 30B13 TaxID=3384241 RepID=UPI003B91D2A6